MTKKLYVYTRLDQCDPASSAWHREGGLVVVTAGYPNDAVPLGTGNQYTVTTGDITETRFGLPEPDHVYVVPDDAPDQVIVFPDAGCC